ncbi:hydroxyisourate hydrolase [Niveispirillum cyanobacteriorum]|uniref:5-hydroxyisourate hydrolase n=1 Tax=Niveispirillum cyanobacteriorum TaxID=1612173 RepID=A0A2K9NIM8_9PROT|nr:hydroxyisourate hydrolase [Niveispirillum cyanobacteriorum]AUN32957.1 hydroxyisourate hydrolase [Niveispirillum cyanobacteriorum]GGE46751.1 5-hydroxyisourate hydrolase 2 [Niveispirillum cyanobacteriorum]
MARLSTHVLDTSTGRPAAGLKLELFYLEGGQRALIRTEWTNQDGRTDSPLLSGHAIPIGTYELLFQAGDYFRSLGVPLADPPFLDEIPLRFAIAEAQGHYHVPLLLSPWSYSTYRGS